MDVKYVLLAFIICSLFNPLAIKIGNKYILDKPNKRKVHTIPKPRSGGIAIFLTILIFSFFNISVRGILLPIAIIFTIGIVDDIFSLPAKVKLLFQIIVAGITYSLGYRIDSVSLGHFNLNFTYLTPIVSILWMVGMMNSINLIDGLDGLATSMVLISTLAFIFLTYDSTLIIPRIVVGICLAFLRVNKCPAKVFLGDSGSLLLGFLLSVIAIQTIQINEYPQIIAVVFIVFVPVLDTTWAFLRRIINKKPVFSPDKEHLHHKILKALSKDDKTLMAIIILSIYAAFIGILLFIDLSIITILLSLTLIPFTFIMYNFDKYSTLLLPFIDMKKEAAITKVNENK
ncbi:glycosyltransferase family 4 protein [Anaerobranca gottschalkii]|uniref:UDP-GlcNAc:undecaprenyl-phosphate GlcNAc-1-phosphate transferase n=1 Tax=Anaerobranca gottschalkii DSM 13577 TaxID=1120990 RepID=A0A1I0BD39_9FIRM|nr:MraY family glycosyltransferase [Anaerobranca gottschalkii]SET04693.1 UDP-GlcNAc:undecaprenyl-phosphate GlcNAc-1-phosphate transferase [Anaerobranca gottschalkii DSM 13577]